MPLMGASTRIEFDSLTSAVIVVASQNCVLTAVRGINNSGGTAAYIQIFDANLATSVTLGTTVPDWVVKTPAGDPSDGDGLPTNGLLFVSGIAVASTTLPTGNVSATQHVKLGIW